MKLKTSIMTLVAATALAACGEKAVEEVTEVATEAVEEVTGSGLDSVDSRLSYIVGTNIAKQFERDGIALDEKALALAITDINEGAEPRLNQEQVQATVQEMQARVRAKQEEEAVAQQAELAVAGEKNKVDGEAFLSANAQKEGVVVTDTGLQYKVITAGDGAKPQASDTVSVHYRGTLIDGTEFDSSYSRGEPATFPVQGVIAGWVEALQLMSVGDKYELAIPSDLAYGPAGTGGDIGPNATLIFEVELLEIVSAE